MRVMLVGHYPVGALECSYRTAFEALGCQVRSFDIVQAVNDHCRGGRFGRLFNTFVQVEPWIRKGNRDLVLAAIEFHPHVVISFGYYPLRVGALAQIRASTSAALVHIWPDPFVNWSTDLTSCLPLYDLVATFSKITIPVFEALGARRVAWIPLAGDPALHPDVPCTHEDLNKYAAEVTFIGAWRPERESVLSGLDGLSVRIWGPDWGRKARNNPVVKKAWQGRSIYGSEFAKAVRCSKINLNIIDATIDQSPNMRFFEIPLAGGLEVSSVCLEMENEFKNGEHLFYFRSKRDLRTLIDYLLRDTTKREQVAEVGHAKVLSAHTYSHRVEMILNVLEDQVVDGRDASIEDTGDLLRQP